MTQVNVSDFRANLPTYLNRVYAGEEFLIVKNSIPVAHLNPVDNKVKVKKSILPGSTTLLSHLEGTTLEIADKLRNDAWYGTNIN